MSEELKSCPFCRSGEVRGYNLLAHTDSRQEDWKITCVVEQVRACTVTVKLSVLHVKVKVR